MAAEYLMRNWLASTYHEVMHPDLNRLAAAGWRVAQFQYDAGFYHVLLIRQSADSHQVPR